ncbi:MAG: glycosyltransferase family 2 protein, partial [Bacteroidota bacterium]
MMKKNIYDSSVSILVVTHNHVEFIEKLLDSLKTFGYRNVYICDASSSDGTLEILQNSPFSANLLKKLHLEGFSKNNNDLIRHFNLDTDYFLLLNPDTYFDTDFLSSLLNRAKEDSGIGIIAPLVRYPDGRIQVTWKRFPRVSTVIKKRIGLLKAENEVQMKGPIIDWCLGACMLISKALLKDGGNLLDERYRLYCEDSDICFEANIRGLRVIGYENAYIYHNLNEKSSKNIFSKYNWWNIKSVAKFFLKWNIKWVFRK